MAGSTLEKLTTGMQEAASETSSRSPQAHRPEHLAAIHCENLSVFYGAQQALFNISMDIPRHRVTSFIGPSGCGKSTLLRSFNRMNDVIENVRLEGKVLIEGENIYEPGTHLPTLRKNVGMVFQKSNPFPMSVRDNILFGPRRQGVKNRALLEQIIEDSLRRADLWNEVKDRLHTSALDLSGGQQQRLCIARALANSPRILLMDEPASALDPISTAKIEETIYELKDEYTVVIVTHNLQQAARCSDITAFLYLGKLIEMNETAKVFRNPSNKQTEDYVSGRFG